MTDDREVGKDSQTPQRERNAVDRRDARYFSVSVLVRAGGGRSRGGVCAPLRRRLVVMGGGDGI